jgi:uncharacterized protein YgbK (DUF1537 family)
VADHKLVTGGAGIARGLPANFRRRDCLPQRIETRRPDLRGPLAILAGSCSEATRAQVAALPDRCPSMALDPIALAEGRQTVDELMAEAAAALETGTVLIHSTASPDEVAKVQEALGPGKAGEILDHAFGEIAARLVAKGVRTFVVAGGETSGAVAASLGLRQLRFGHEIDPGVPWTQHLGDPPVHVAFKSGNFGAEDFFSKALGDLAS